MEPVRKPDSQEKRESRPSESPSPKEAPPRDAVEAGIRFMDEYADSFRRLAK